MVAACRALEVFSTTLRDFLPFSPFFFPYGPHTRTRRERDNILPKSSRTLLSGVFVNPPAEERKHNNVFLLCSCRIKEQTKLFELFLKNLPAAYERGSRKSWGSVKTPRTKSLFFFLFDPSNDSSWQSFGTGVGSSVRSLSANGAFSCTVSIDCPTLETFSSFFIFPHPPFLFGTGCYVFLHVHWTADFACSCLFAECCVRLSVPPSPVHAFP